MPKGIYRYGCLGYCKPGLGPTKKVTPNDFCWAAGFFEGEGSTDDSGGTVHAIVCQKDPWTLLRMKALFGGSVSSSKKRLPYWHVSGARARGFLMSVYGLLSPRRQEQIRKAMHVGEFKC